MSELNESESKSVHLIPNKLRKRKPNFVEKYYFLLELSIVKLSITKYLIYQYGITVKNPLYICVTPTKNIRF